MASPTVQIPGRRISYGEIYYTGWVPRGGDCLTVVAECMIAPTSGKLVVTPQTRGEDGSTVYDVNVALGGIEMDTVGISTAICLASTSTSPSNGAQEMVRLKVEFQEGSAGDYGVLRVFPISFFDSAKSY